MENPNPSKPDDDNEASDTEWGSLIENLLYGEADQVETAPCDDIIRLVPGGYNCTFAEFEALVANNARVNQIMADEDGDQIMTENGRPIQCVKEKNELIKGESLSVNDSQSEFIHLPRNRDVMGLQYPIQSFYSQCFVCETFLWLINPIRSLNSSNFRYVDPVPHNPEGTKQGTEQDSVVSAGPGTDIPVVPAELGTGDIPVVLDQVNPVPHNPEGTEQDPVVPTGPGTDIPVVPARSATGTDIPVVLDQVDPVPHNPEGTEQDPVIPAGPGKRTDIPVVLAESGTTGTDIPVVHDQVILIDVPEQLDSVAGRAGHSGTRVNTTDEPASKTKKRTASDEIIPSSSNPKKRRTYRKRLNIATPYAVAQLSKSKTSQVLCKAYNKYTEVRDEIDNSLFMETRKVYIHKFVEGTVTSDISRVLGVFGEIEEVKILLGFHGRVAYALFSEPKDAQEALSNPRGVVNGTEVEFHSGLLPCEHCKGSYAQF
ncbi:hypothetical protein CASFOL_017068 [Castilleja foliolosa]|uniref:RRM domain-containing protein n=1 Tax=Castilleja foliolosa TaxID=1961234 RepID=A0ABD3DDZ7_9LAMI